jgi:hypothetical protein
MADMARQNDSQWFAKEQASMRAKAPSPQQHIDNAFSHLSAAQSSLSAQDHDGAAYHLGAVSQHTMAAGNHYATHSKHWIQSAIKHPGSFTKQARAAHKTVAGLAAAVTKSPEKYSSATVKRANLAKTLSKMRKK